MIFSRLYNETTANSTKEKTEGAIVYLAKYFKEKN